MIYTSVLMLAGIRDILLTRRATSLSNNICSAMDHSTVPRGSETDGCLPSPGAEFVGGARRLIPARVLRPWSGFEPTASRQSGATVFAYYVRSRASTVW